MKITSFWGKVIAGIAILIVLVPIGFYIYNFWRYPISDDGAKWGTFGDYMGGTLNPILSLLTLLVTVYIAYELSGLDEKRSKEAMAFEKQRFINELREAEYRRITTLLQDIPGLFLESNNDQDKMSVSSKVVLTYTNFKFFTQFNGHIFPFLQGDICKKFAGCLEHLSAIARKEKLASRQELMDALQNYMLLLVKLSQEFQKHIIEEME